MIDRAETEIDAVVGDETFGLHRQRIERLDDHRPVAGIFRELTPLLDQSPRQRILEAPRRQHDLDRLAAPDLTADIRRLEPKLDPLTRQRVLADIEQRRRIDLFGSGPRDLEAQHRWTLERQPRSGERRRLRPRLRGIDSLRRGLAHLHFGTLDAVIVFRFVGHAHGPARGAVDVLGQRNLRQLVGDDVERPKPKLARAGERANASRFADLVANLRDVGGIAALRFLRSNRKRLSRAVAQDFEREPCRTEADASEREQTAIGNLEKLALPLSVVGDRLSAISQQDRRQRRIRRRRHPGIDAGGRALLTATETKGGRQPVAEASRRQHHDRHEKHKQKPAHRPRIDAIRPRRRTSDPEPRNGAGQTFPVRLPNSGRGGIPGARGQRIFI